MFVHESTPKQSVGTERFSIKFVFRLRAGHSTLHGDDAQSSANRVSTNEGEVHGAGMVSLLLVAGKPVVPLVGYHTVP